MSVPWSLGPHFGFLLLPRIPQPTPECYIIID